MKIFNLKNILFVAIICALCLSIALNFYMYSHNKFKFYETDQAFFYIVDGKGSLIFLKDGFMNKLFGKDWESQKLYRNYHKLMSKKYKDFTITDGNATPIDHFSLPYFELREDAIADCSLYSIDKKVFVGMEIDVRKHTITVYDRNTFYNRKDVILPNGQLQWREVGWNIKSNKMK